MKKVFIALVSFALAATISSCKKDDGNTNNSNNNHGSACSNGHLCFTIAGQDYSYPGTLINITDNLHAIEYLDTTNSNYPMAIVYIKGNSVGIYTVDTSEISAQGPTYFYTNVTEVNNYLQTSGTINVTSTNSGWSGNFSGTGILRDNDGNAVQNNVSVSGSFQNIQ